MATVDLEGIPAVALGALTEYLIAHEMQIGDMEGDFVELAPIFFYLFDRHAGGIKNLMELADTQSKGDGHGSP